MRLVGIYLNDDELLALAERLRTLGLDVDADRLIEAYYRDARQLDLRGVEPQTFIPALEGGPASFAELRAALLVEHGQAKSRRALDDVARKRGAEGGRW